MCAADELCISSLLNLMHAFFHFSIAIFEAEGISAPLNRNLNDHMTELLRLKAQYKLATNDKVIGTIQLMYFHERYHFLIINNYHFSCPINSL